MKYFKYLLISLLLTIGSAINAVHADTDQAEVGDPAEIVAGERLFLETRFSQHFKRFLDKGGKVNQPLDSGDPALKKLMRFFGLPPYQIPFTEGAFAGKSFNCRACHLVDEHANTNTLGMRAYADYAARSPLPTRDDGHVTTTRNSPALVDAALPRENTVLHLDAEFPSLPNVVRTTLADRNMGWLPGEDELAYAHVCRVVREDDGSDELAQDFGGLSYAELFSATSRGGKPVTGDYRLPEEYTLNVQEAECTSIIDAVVSLLTVYVEDLAYGQDESARSPYDVFLAANGLPAKPEENETDIDYSRRLLAAIDKRLAANALKFIKSNPATEDGGFRYHDQPYVFGEEELRGLRVFFTEQGSARSGNGNCIACHAAPHFTDFGLHNTGITQVEYDNIHGVGAFGKLHIPRLDERKKAADRYLPPTHAHPERQGIFRQPPNEDNPAAIDLGVWNILYNEDYPLPQAPIHNLLCNGETVNCQSKDDVLDRSVAAFKTPGLRNLGHTAPYMHNGVISDLHAVVAFYLTASQNSRQGKIRNAAAELSDIHLNAADINPLVLFMVSLYEDYE